MNKFTVAGKTKLVNTTILAPENAGLRVVVNIVGQNGKFDTKLDTILTKKWGKVRESYKEWFAVQQDFKLGSISNTAVASDVWVVSLLAEDKNGKINLVALDTAVKKLRDLTKYEKASVHVSTLTTQAVPELEALLAKYLLDEGVNVYFYNEPVKQ